MDFTLSKQQQMVQKMYKEFAENEVKPLAKKVDAEEYFPKAVSYTHLDVYKRQGPYCDINKSTAVDGLARQRRCGLFYVGISSS